MAELMRTTTSLGKLVVEQGPMGLVVTISRLGWKKVFSRDKVTSVTNGIGGGSIMFTHTVVVTLIGGEQIVMRNVPKQAADQLQMMLS